MAAEILIEYKTVRNDFYKIRNRSHPLLYAFAFTSIKTRRFDAFHSHRLLKLTTDDLSVSGNRNL
jgi:hypothetical protein